MSNFRCIAITPYYKEHRKTLERCINSVKAQSLACEQLMIADGHPQDWLDEAGVRHLRLDRSHGDYGNTPRGLGAMLALAEEYDALFFLDADNWLEHTHVEECLLAARQAFTDASLCDYVIAKRAFRRPDETVMPLGEDPGHVDTNCFFFLCGSFHLLPLWITMPKAVALFGDRIFLKLLDSVKLQGATTRFATVNYLCTWPRLYLSIGEAVPAGIDPDKALDPRPILATMKALTDREREIARRLLGGMQLGF